MERNYAAGIIIAIIIIVGAIFLVRSGTSTPNTDNNGLLDIPKSITVSLAAQNNSKETGTATITNTDTGSKVVIDLQNAPTGSAQPAHIHVGSCPTPGGIKYPLVSLMNGHSETMIDATVEELLAELPLAINVHRSATMLNAYVSCGNIASSTNPLGI